MTDYTVTISDITARDHADDIVALVKKYVDDNGLHPVEIWVQRN